MTYPASHMGPRPVLSALVWEAVKKAGNAGCLMAELEAATGKQSEQLLGILGNLRGRDGRRQMLYSLPVYGRLARYFDTSVPLEHAQALVQREAEQMRELARRYGV